MNKILSSFLISFFLILISTSSFSGGDDISVLQEELDMILMEDPCFNQLESDIDDEGNITSVMLIKGDGSFTQGDEIMSSSNVKAIVESYDSDKNQLTYYQTAETGFRSFSIGEKLVGKGVNVVTIEEFVLDFVVPCSDLIVSIEENPEQMIFVFADSEAAIQAKLAAQAMMAEIEEEMARAAALAAFLQKLEDEKAAAAKSTAAYQSKLAREAEIAARMKQLAIEQELALFEARLEAELAAQEMMAEIEEEMARAAALAAFQQKLEDERAAAAAATAAYREQLAIEEELAAFEAELEAQLAAEALALAAKKEIALFEAKLEAELAAQAMMAEIEEEMARAAALAAFLQKLEDEKAAAAAATAAYRASLEDEVIVVTEEAHEACKYALGLSDANIALFESALADGALFNKCPQSSNGTQFGASRWDAYANCVSNYVNPF